LGKGRGFEACGAVRKKRIEKRELMVKHLNIALSSLTTIVLSDNNNIINLF